MNEDININKNTKIEKGIIANLLVVISSFVFCIYLFKLFSMQVIEGSTYKIQSKTISSRYVTIVAQRGEIYDRNNDNALVVNSDSFAVEITPGDIPAEDFDTITAKLASILGISKAEIDERVPIEIRKTFNPITVKTNVSFSAISNIAENINDLPGISWVSRPIRNYIETRSFSHVLGYVGKITRDEMNEMYNKGGYNKNSIVGKIGVEKQYDSLLQGKDGYEEKTVDVRGRVLSDTSVSVPPKMGNKLVLTIDSRVQNLCEKALGERIGSILVLKPSTGEILAMVSYPYFDSNLFNTENYADAYQKLITSENKPFLNRAVNAAYAPASTFKIVMSAAILAEKAFPEYERVECKGEIEHGGRIFHCWILKPGHGKLDLKHAVGHSCDIYFWQVGRTYLGIDKIAEYAKMFGFGQSTQIDLPSHSKGFVPNAQWKERKYHERWLDGDTMAVSIGQGYTTATPLQVADVMCMVCNEGKIYKPHLLKEVRDPVTDEIIQEIKPEIMFQNNIDSTTWKKIKEALRFVATDGSAKYAMQNPTVKIACKTGTAEVNGYTDNWHNWLLAYAPYDAPIEDQIVVCTMVEAANEKWEWWATYAANFVIQGYFANETLEEAAKSLHFDFLIKPTRLME
ncbi:MAG: penicillin-binding protein 2 [Treponema sp.]|uniref:penicillin-binding protein 2 n=1 Tax=Treponema sp. TaxID=166 RepID=UPI00298EB440|nr:penicillin-binding protein 2 [Treponema sp.]MBR5934422.1 penicillin-binding protein 2 [Treponema sp.]